MSASFLFRTSLDPALGARHKPVVTAIPLSQPSANASSRRLQLPHAAAYKTTLVPLLCCRPVADLRFGRSNVQKCRLLHICCRKSTPPPHPFPLSSVINVKEVKREAINLRRNYLNIFKYNKCILCQLWHI